MFQWKRHLSLLVLGLSCLAAPTANAEDSIILDHGGATLRASTTEIVVSKAAEPILQLDAFLFNFTRVDAWTVARGVNGGIILSAVLPPSVDYYRSAFDHEPRVLEIAISGVEGGFRFSSAPTWGRQVGLEFEYLGDHFFGLSEPLQPDNRLTPDLTGTSIVVDVLSEAASMRENYASAFSSFFMSSHGYGAFFDTFARGRYDFAVNGLNRIHHETGTLDWYVFVGDSGAEIHRHYFSLIGAPKAPPLWGLGPIAWRDQNDGGAQEILSDISRFTELEIPLTGWFVDRPYSDGNHAWSKMDFSEKFADPSRWIQTIRTEFGLEFMTWAATATFGDRRFGKHLGGRYSYLDLSHPETVAAFQRELSIRQYAVGVHGHKIDRTDEVFAEHEPWHDDTPLPERRNRYTYLVAKTFHDAAQRAWGDNHFLFARAAIHRTQPYLSAIWGGDPRSTWEGFQGNFANAMRTSFLGFPIWGTDAGGYLGEGYIPEDLYLRWLQAASMAGLFEIKLDGSGGQGRDRMPWRYDQEFQHRFRQICRDRMAFLPYLYSLAATSATNGVLMKPMAYQYLDDEKTWGLWDQFMLGDAILVAPVFSEEPGREVYLPEGRWRSLDDPSVVRNGGQTIRVEADLDTLPRFIRENSIFVLGSGQGGNVFRWRNDPQRLSVFVNPATETGRHTFVYVDPSSGQRLPITVDATASSIRVTGAPLPMGSTVSVFLDARPESVSVPNGGAQWDYEGEKSCVAVDIAAGAPVDLMISRKE